MIVKFSFQTMNATEKQFAIGEIKKGIIKVQFLDDFVCDVEHIMLIYYELKKISDKQRNKLFVSYTFGKYTSITLEAIKFISKGNQSNSVMMESFVVQTFSQRVMVRFLIKVLNPIVPVIYFNTTIEAEEWFNNIYIT
jgi:hypothetical protein